MVITLKCPQEWLMFTAVSSLSPVRTQTYVERITGIANNPQQESKFYEACSSINLIALSMKQTHITCGRKN